MGTYTELVLKCRVKENSPEIVHEVLKYLFSDKNVFMPKELPDHELFKDDRWESIGRGSSYYHIPCNPCFFNGKYLFSRSDLKNYNGTIELFLDWLSPYVYGHCIGWIWHEDWDEPQLVYVKINE